MSVELRPFTEADVGAAAALLAAAHAQHRTTEPLLADADVQQAVGAAWAREGAAGSVALRDGEVLGFLVGHGSETPLWGRHVFVDRAGHAAVEPELVRDLFAHAADRWWDDGVRRFFVVVPSLRERLAPWERLGFAQMHQDAVRDTGGEPSAPAGLTIRRGGPADADLALRINAEIGAAHTRSPSFAPDVPPTREDWVETLEDADVAYFVAEREGRPVGHTTLYPAAPEFGTPADAVYLASTATLPGARGSGAGVALVAHARAWARDAGYGTVWTNWRTTNLLPSRFFPARGFRPTYVRLHRAPGIA